MPTVGAGLIKLGSQRLNVQGDGTYRGDVDVRDGVLRARTTPPWACPGQHHRPGGAALELSHGHAVCSQLQRRHRRRHPGRPGRTPRPQRHRLHPRAQRHRHGPASRRSRSSTDDHLWRGPITLNTDVAIDINGRQPPVALRHHRRRRRCRRAAGFTKLGVGKLVLGAASTYRGITNVNEGVLNLQSSGALGSLSGSTGGTVVANNAGIELQGDITIAGEASPSWATARRPARTSPSRWFQQGPRPDDATARRPATRTSPAAVTGIATDPSDANVIYVAAAGGGVWRTKDGGQTWQPLIDQVNDAQRQSDQRPDPVHGLDRDLADRSALHLHRHRRTEQQHRRLVRPARRQLLRPRRACSPATTAGPGRCCRAIRIRTSWTAAASPRSSWTRSTRASSTWRSTQTPAGGVLPASNGGIWKYDTTANPLTPWVNLTAASAAAPLDGDAVAHERRFLRPDRASTTSTSAIPERTRNRFIVAAIGNEEPLRSELTNAAYLSVDGGLTWQILNFPVSETINNTTVPTNGRDQAGRRLRRGPRHQQPQPRPGPRHLHLLRLGRISEFLRRR